MNKRKLFIVGLCLAFIQSMRSMDIDLHRRLLDAASKDDLEKVRFLLTCPDIDVNVVDDAYEWTCLHWASHEGYEDLVKALIGAKADLDCRTKHTGETPLHFAIQNGHEGVMQILLNAGACLDISNKAGLSLLHKAVENDLMLQKLLSLKCLNINSCNVYGWTPLHHAACKNCIDAVQILLKAGADITPRTHDGKTPIQYTENQEIRNLIHRWAKDQITAFLMASHPRLGEDSPVNLLSTELFRCIWQYLKPE